MDSYEYLDRVVATTLNVLTEATVAFTPPTDIALGDPYNRFAGWMMSHRLISVGLSSFGFTPADLLTYALANSRVIVRDRPTRDKYKETLQAPVFAYEDISGNRNFEVVDFDNLFICGHNFANYEIDYLINRLIRRHSQLIYWIR